MIRYGPVVRGKAVEAQTIDLITGDRRRVYICTGEQPNGLAFCIHVDADQVDEGVEKDGIDLATYLRREIEVGS